MKTRVQLVNSKVLRMDVVDLGRNVDGMFLPVTVAIYQNEVGSQQYAGHLKWRLARLATRSCMDSFKD